MRTRVYRAALSTYIVFGSIFGIPTAAVAFNWRRAGAGQMMATIAVAAAFCFVWIARYQIVISEETLYFRSLLASSQAPRRAIRSAEVIFQSSARGGPLRLS